MSGTLGFALDEVPVAQCTGCGVSIGNPDFLTFPYCEECDGPAPYRYGANRPACQLCAEPIFAGDGEPTNTRHRWCARFLARLDADHAAWAATRRAARTEDAHALNAA